jgi:pyrimidine-nucleoside phosphorylase
MRATDIIRKKRDGHALTAGEIEAFVRAASHRSWPDYQLSALLMAIFLRGMSSEEAACLARAMLHSGTVLDWGPDAGRAVDKHSTGGVGDKTSLILAPLAASVGALVPMMSGRGLGHTGGTLDKLEAIPGFRTALTAEEARKILLSAGCVMMSQTAEVAPADRTLYALRDVTATVESIPLISASIMCKKLAEGVRGLVLDVKFGDGAFMTELASARELANSMRAIGHAHGVRTRALLTRMEHPLGRACGNSLEVAECIEVLRGGGPAAVRDLSLTLASHMADLAGVADARGKCEAALASGKALEVFRRMIEAQGGDPRVIDAPEALPRAPHVHIVRAERAGHFHGWKARAIGRAVVRLGGGREVAEARVDHGVGAVALAHPGDMVKPGDGLLEIHYRTPEHLGEALAEVEGAGTIHDHPPTLTPLVHETLE